MKKSKNSTCPNLIFHVKSDLISCEICLLQGDAVTSHWDSAFIQGSIMAPAIGQVKYFLYYLFIIN